MPGGNATDNVIVIWSMWQAESVPLGRYVGQIILAEFVVVLLCVGMGVTARCGRFWGVRVHRVCIWCVICCLGWRLEVDAQEWPGRLMWAMGGRDVPRVK
jgi:hypothetical protein